MDRDVVLGFFAARGQLEVDGERVSEVSGDDGQQRWVSFARVERYMEVRSAFLRLIRR